MESVCLVIGAGAGIGSNVARRFAREGYHACLCRRSDGQGLEEMVTSIRNDGGLATGFILMSGGGSEDPSVFSDAIFNTQRLTIAPLLILLGLTIEVFAILYKER